MSSVVTWVLITICGVLGYRFAARARQLFGVSPWRIPPILWGLLCAFVPVLGLLLEAVAQMTTRRPAQPAGRLDRWQGSPATTTGAGGLGRPPTEPTAGPSVLAEAQVGERRLPGPEGWRPAEAGEATASIPPLFGWYPDPTRRHRLRYWDGRHWSDTVSDGADRGTDPLP